MNKEIRKEYKKLKYLKRLNKLGYSKDITNQLLKNPRTEIDGVKFNMTCYKNTSTPCSCFICSNKKYKGSKFKYETRKVLSQDET